MLRKGRLGDHYRSRAISVRQCNVNKPCKRSTDRIIDIVCVRITPQRWKRASSKIEPSKFGKFRLSAPHGPRFSHFGDPNPSISLQSSKMRLRAVEREGRQAEWAASGGPGQRAARAMHLRKNSREKSRESFVLSSRITGDPMGGTHDCTTTFVVEVLDELAC